MNSAMGAVSVEWCKVVFLTISAKKFIVKSVTNLNENNRRKYPLTYLVVIIFMFLCTD